MGRIVVRLLLFLAVLAVFAVVGFAYLGDLSPMQTDVVLPVDLNAD